jgi:hypothetical protein
MNKLNIYLETGQKRTFAGAIDWPGWCRMGPDEGSALQTLLDYGPRYARVLHGTTLGFQPPADISNFVVVEQLVGNSTTDFGAPDMAPSSDAKPVDEAELQRFQTLLDACWCALDKAVRAATGKELRKGPRGGGRDIEGIVQHVLGSDASYLSMIGGELKKGTANNLEEELTQTRQGILSALEVAFRVGVPTQGPRGGARWTLRYFVRRSAWHVLDHVWEIEDRII